jgi:hypothetical protein
MKRLLIASAAIVCLPFVLFGNFFGEGNRSYLQGDYDKALESYNQFIQKEPKKFEGYYNAGNALFRQEQYEQALQMYNKALELNPKDEDTQANIAVTEDRIKNRPKDKDQKNKKDNKDNKDNKQQNQGQNQQGQGGKNQQSGKQSQGQDQKSQAGSQQGQSQQGKGGNKGQNGTMGKGQAQPSQPSQQQKQPPAGMTKDEVQALLNTMQNQEKQYRGYFGKQPRAQNQREQNLMNMSPDEIIQYMQRQMMDPNMVQQPPKGDSKEKDW